MPRIFVVVALLCLSLTLATLSAGTAGAAIKFLDHPHALPRRYIVSLQTAHDPATTTTTTTTHDQRVAAFLNHASTSGLHILHHHVLGHASPQSLHCVIEIETDHDKHHEGRDHALLAAIPNVRKIEKVIRLQRPATTVHNSPLSRRDIPSLLLAGVSNSTSIPSSHGRGATVCIIDSGIDYKHPALGGGLGPSFKVTHGYDLVGDNWSPGKTKIPDDDPMDCAGHGTHVAGIIAAVDVEGRGVAGVAPQANLGVYKIFGCGEDTDTAAVTDALGRATSSEANCTTINLSLGGDSTIDAWLSDNNTIASDLISTAVGSIPLVAAAGNDGLLGAFHVGAPAVSPSVVAVGSVDNTFFHARRFDIVHDPNSTISNSSKSAFFYIPVSDRPINITAAILRLSSPNTTSTSLPPYDACAPFPPHTFDSSIAVIRRGQCLFVDKLKHVRDAGAIGAIVYNNVPGLIGDIPNPYIRQGFLVLTMSDVDGLALVGEIVAAGDDGLRVAVAPNDVLIMDDRNGGSASIFSSWGPSPDLDIKPDIVAPGGNIFSTYPLALGGYASLSGTSMASPVLAAAFAILMTSAPTSASNTSELAIRLLNTANPVRIPDLDGRRTAPVAIQGAGLVNVSAALTTPLRVTPPKIALAPGALWSMAVNFSLTISSTVDIDVTIAVVPAASVDVSDPRRPVIIPDTYLNSTVSASSLHILANTPATLDVTLHAPDGRPAPSTSVLATSGHIHISSRTHTSTVPYSLIVGDYDASTSPYNILDVTIHPPYISTDSNPQQPPPTSLPRLTRGASLIINLHLDIPSPLTSILILPRATNIDDPAIRESIAFTLATGDPPASTVAAIRGLSLPMNDLDDTNARLYTSLLWDASVDFLGGERVAGGWYRVLVVVLGPYGAAGGVGVWASDVFRVDA